MAVQALLPLPPPKPRVSATTARKKLLLQLTENVDQEGPILGLRDEDGQKELEGFGITRACV